MYIPSSVMKMVVGGMGAAAAVAVATKVAKDNREAQLEGPVEVPPIDTTAQEIPTSSTPTGTRVNTNNNQKESVKENKDDNVESVSGEVVYNSGKTVEDNNITVPPEVNPNLPIVSTPKEKFIFKESIDDFIDKVSSGVPVTTPIERYELEIIVPTILYWTDRIEMAHLFTKLNTDIDKMYANTISIGIMNMPLSKKIPTIDDTLSVCNIDILNRVVELLSSAYPDDQILDSIRENIHPLVVEYNKRYKSDAYYKLRDQNVWPILSVNVNPNNIYNNGALYLYGRNRYYKLEELFQEILQQFQPMNHKFSPSDRDGVVSLDCYTVNGYNQNYHVDIDPTGSIEGTGCPELFAYFQDQAGYVYRILVPIHDFGKGSFSIAGGMNLLNKILSGQLLTMQEKEMVDSSKNFLGGMIYRSIDFTKSIAPDSNQFNNIKSIVDFIYSLDIPTMIHNTGNASFIPDISNIRFRVLDYNWNNLTFVLTSDDKVRKQVEDFDNMSILNGLAIKVLNGMVSVYYNSRLLQMVQKNNQYKNTVNPQDIIR